MILRSLDTKVSYFQFFSRVNKGNGCVRKMPFRLIARSISSVQCEEFRVFDVTRGRGKAKVKARPTRQCRPPRSQRMKIDQNWTNVWPHAQSFKASVVPLPVRQGMISSMLDNDGIVPHKYANAELMKIPNFFHLTPLHVQKHCESLKTKFCSEFPDELKDEATLRAYMPLRIETIDIVQSSVSIRDERSRVVKLTVGLDSLALDERSQDKLIRILGENRYDPKTRTIAIIADSCPYRNQNYDYAQYLLQVVYDEAVKKEEWEKLKCPFDWERYYWDDESECKKKAMQLLQRRSTNAETHEVLESYGNAVRKLYDESESAENIDQYRKSVERLLSSQ